MAKKTIVFIHGNFVNYECWEKWVGHYEAKGYKCIALAYPERDKTVKELVEEHPNPKVGKVTLSDVIDHLSKSIKKLDEAPIIIGHSFGGLLTQILINKGFGAAAVAVDSVPPPGVLTTKLSFVRSLAPVVNPLTPAGRPWLMPFKHFQYTFVNGMPLDEQRKAYERYVVPESIRLARGALSGDAKVDFKKAHAPLLLIGGEIDHIMPASLNNTNFKRYKASAPSITDYKEFPGRNHYTIIAGKGWEEVANYALNWAEKQLATVAV